MVIASAQQPTRVYGFIDVLDVYGFGFAKHGHALDKPGRRLAQHHSTRWCGGLHPLRHADLLADGGVIRCGRADVAGDDLT